MDVREVMTADPVAVDRDASLQRAVGKMLEHSIGSVLITEGERTVGILTDSDVLRAGYLSERALPEIPVEREMSSPLVTTHPDDSLSAAVETLREEGIKKLPVESDLEIVGIVTTTDLATHHPEILADARAVGEGGADGE
jgi:CBS domain-containing protein